jgi:membrane associated rhomboid family serine protease
VLLFYFVVEVPALLCIGLWALTQFANGFGSVARTVETGGVAYLAHIGGFVAGVAVALVWRAVAGVPGRRAAVGPRRPW